MTVTKTTNMTTIAMTITTAKTNIDDVYCPDIQEKNLIPLSYLLLDDVCLDRRDLASLRRLSVHRSICLFRKKQRGVLLFVQFYQMPYKYVRKWLQVIFV